MDIALAAKKRDDGGDEGHDERDGEGEYETVHEGLRDQGREEPLTDDDARLTGWHVLENSELL